jgi:cobalt-zinc-cadmium efflux system membrane fusion protein
LKRHAIFSLAVALACAAACSPKQKPVEPASPRLLGDLIQYAENAKELDSLALQPVEPSPGAAVHTTGRLAWDEDRTRVFPAVGGRVSRLLAVLESPDLGQAQADANRAATDLATAERNLARARLLNADGVISKKDLDAAEADRDHAR